ncbi:hypothetical protein D3C84_723750 [compost metagenome]
MRGAKTRPHVHAFSPQRQGGSQPTSLADTTRSDDRNPQRPHSQGDEDQPWHIVFTRMAGTLEAINGNGVHPITFGG